MTVTATVELSRFDRAAEGMAMMSDRAADLSPLMANIGMLLEGSARDRIESTNVAPDGVAWPKSMRAEEKGGKTLFDSGLLAASLTNQPSANQVEIGSNRIYAGVHQLGMTILPKAGSVLTFTLANGTTVSVASVTIPARPYLGISDDDEVEINALVADHFFPDGVPT